MTPRDNSVTGGATKTLSALPSADAHDVRQVRGMLHGLEQLGYDLDGLLASAGLQRCDVEDPEALLSPKACAAVFEHADRERRVPNLALQLAQRTPIGTNPLLDYLLVTSDSVDQGLERLTRYLRLVNPSVGLAIRRECSPVRVVVERAQAPFFAELTLSLCVIRFMRETDDQFRAAYVSFTHEPDDVGEYATVLRCPIRAKASWNGVAIAKRTLEIPLRRRDPVLRSWLERQAGAILARLPAGGDACDEVRSVLSTQATAGEMTIDAVARRLSTTPRTLQRRLARGGTSFEALRDDARRQAAEQYLSQATLTIAEVTYLLGYSEPTAFHRAFRRWHGTTPQAFRAQAASSSKSEG
jgi:AraC-like DNA-binding protein